MEQYIMAKNNSAKKTTTVDIDAINAAAAAASGNDAGDTTGDNTTGNTPTKSNVARVPVQTPQLSDKLSSSAVLFVVEDRSEDGPVYSGSIEISGVKVPMSGFLKQAQESGKDYLNLTIGDKNQAHYYGVLFKNRRIQENLNQSYSGNIKVLRVEGGTTYTPEQWDNAPTLKLSGLRVRSANGGVRINIAVNPTLVDDDEMPF
jgi:hypothetical protein